ncbi:MAG: cytochrome c [Vicingaceae bacterium]|jgi:cytochrome c
MKYLIASSATVACLVMVLALKTPEPIFSAKTTISEVLTALGEDLPSHARPNATAEQILQGADLVFKGRTIGPDGKKSKYISRFYTCTSCHSPVKEDSNVASFDPQARLDYAEENGLKFLQGSTFYGIANRESWYNDDYYKKYGDLVKPARNSLAESTQLCAKVCSSGRYLEDWELEAILAYYWNNQLKIEDLELSEKELDAIENQKNRSESIALLKKKYSLKSPATFGSSPNRQDLGFEGIQGNPENGKKVYELSCMSCHQDGGVSGVAFTNSKVDFQKFKRSIGKKTDYNLYDIVRKGTYAGQGKPRYMPLYPKERMSDQQLEDLRAYIEQEAN